MYNLNLVDYHTKIEIDTLLCTSYSSLSFIADNSYSKSEIDSTISDYTTSAQLQTDLYSKVKTNLIFDSYTTTTRLYDDFYSKLCIDNTFLTSAQTRALYYNKTDTGNLLADKVSATGNVSLPGHLDIGTSDYTNSRIRCNAEVGGYTGYAGLQAANSYDLFLNLSTTKSNGGWMYFKINCDSYMQLSGSDNKVIICKETLISSHLKVGVGAVTSNIKAFASHGGNTSYCELKAVNRDHGKSRFNTNYDHGTIYFGINYSNFFRLPTWNHEINFYKPTTGTSDDRLKENEAIIENACGTLSKLRPQLYDKKPDIDNDDHTTWYKESGLIAQEIYYDAPELRHLVCRGSPELDEEGNIIPTSIDPQQDPDYSSWGKEPASVNYIGLIAYLVKANT